MKCDIYDLLIWHRGGIRLQLMEADGGRWRSMEVKKSYYWHLLEVKRPNYALLLEVKEPTFRSSWG